MFTVLFIDDDPSATSVAKEIFTYNNINCVLCDSYDCATLAIDNGKLDVIVVDIELKGEKNGIDVMKYLRTKNVMTPIVVTTGYGDRYNKKLKEFNISSLEKPYSPEQLIEKINQAKINK